MKEINILHKKKKNSLVCFLLLLLTGRKKGLRMLKQNERAVSEGWSILLSSSSNVSHSWAATVPRGGDNMLRIYWSEVGSAFGLQNTLLHTLMYMLTHFQNMCPAMSFWKLYNTNDTERELTSKVPFSINVLYFHSEENHRWRIKVYRRKGRGGRGPS